MASYVVCNGNGLPVTDNVHLRRTGGVPVTPIQHPRMLRATYNSAGGNMFLRLRKMIWYVGRAKYSPPPLKHPLLFYVMPPALFISTLFRIEQST
eukprot:15351137-Ditylum_brightwellii.AAC.1